MKKAKKRKRPKSKNYMGMLAISGVAVLFLGVIFTQGQTLEKRLSNYDDKAASLEKQIEEEKERTKEIDETKAYMQTDEYAEEVARNKLGLVKDNELVFQEEK